MDTHVYTKEQLDIAVSNMQTEVDAIKAFSRTFDIYLVAKILGCTAKSACNFINKRIRQYYVTESCRSSISDFQNQKELRFEPYWPMNLFYAVLGENTKDTTSDDFDMSIDWAMSKLTKREQNIINLYYKENLSLTEISNVFGFTRELARQIKDKALKKLRGPGIRDCIQYGYTFYKEKEKQLSEIKKAERDARIHSIQTSAQDQISSIKSKLNNLSKSLDSISIRDLDLSVRSFNNLYRSGVHTLFDLFNMNDRELSSIKNLGKRSIDEIRDRFEKYTGIPWNQRDSVTPTLYSL